MFRDAYLAKPCVSQWRTPNVTNIQEMFQRASCATPHVGYWGINPAKQSIIDLNWGDAAGVDERCNARSWREVGYSNPNYRHQLSSTGSGNTSSFAFLDPNMWALLTSPDADDNVTFSSGEVPDA